MTYAICPRCRDRWDGYHDELGRCPWETEASAQTNDTESAND